jgi:ribosomal protein S1
LKQEVIAMEMNHENQSVETALYEKTFVTAKPGDVLKGKVVQIQSDAVFVDIGGKTEGIVPFDELSYKPFEHPEQVVRVGDEIDVYVLREDEEGIVRLSKKRADLEKTWIRIRQAKEKGDVLYGTVVEQVKGGLVVDLGVRGFIPASHMGLGKHAPKNLEDYIGETLPLKVLEVDQQKGRVVLSYRSAKEEDYKKKKEEFWNSVYPGEFRKGTVARFANFGAFVDLGGVDGLIHLSELSWKRVKHPSEVLSIGDVVEVLVLGVDREKERVSLSLRRALPDPWLQIPDTFKVGALVEGSVVRIAKRYAFVEVFPGMEALLPLNKETVEKVKEGEKIKARIAEFVPEARRMVLSLKDADGASEEDYRRYLNAEADRPLTLKDILGDKLKTEMGG